MMNGIMGEWHFNNYTNTWKIDYSKLVYSRTFRHDFTYKMGTKSKDIFENLQLLMELNTDGEASLNPTPSFNDGYNPQEYLTSGDDPKKSKAQSGGGLSSTNDWLGYAGYAEGAIGAGQIGMLGYRQSLSISSRIGTFGSFSSTYRALGITGKVLVRIGYVGAVTNTIVDFNSMQSGEIGCGRFAYRTAGTLGSIGGSIAIGASMGGPWGAVGGAVIGGASWAGEKAYDGYMYLQTQMSIYMTNLENGLKSGWVPGR